MHENRAECLFSLLKPYLRVFRGISKTTLPGDVGFFHFLRNFRHLTACEQAAMILYAALDIGLVASTYLNSCDICTIRTAKQWEKRSINPRQSQTNA